LWRGFGEGAGLKTLKRSRNKAKIQKDRPIKSDSASLQDLWKCSSGDVNSASLPKSGGIGFRVFISVLT
jgi:hypothetical protein